MSVGMGWAGLGWAGLGWAGLGWAGMGWDGQAEMETLPVCHCMGSSTVQPGVYYGKVLVRVMFGG